MKQTAVLIFIILFSLTIFAQKPRPTKRATSFTKPSATTVGNEKDELEKAVSEKNAAERIMALNKFVGNFPNSTEKNRALELIVSARAEIADEKLRLSDTASGVELFTIAVKNAPAPVSDKLFAEILLQIPTNLFFRGQQVKAVEIARLIEEKVEGNAKQLLGLATFYIGTENGDEAKRLANKALAVNPNLPTAYQTLGLASRLNFQLEDAANAYAKALELDADSTVSKRSLAEMKRAIGKTDEAVALYREILVKDETDATAQTGLTLALFDAEKKSEAEAEMQKSLAQNSNNLPLLVGAAYWYAAHNDGAKAVELAQQAISVEPRYTWAYIALARGFISQKRPLDAEKVLLTARQYGNFPTLDYEIASARLAAGFYREAAEELKKNFTLKEGVLQTKLGGRVAVKAENFTELLALERRASIFEPSAADNAENTEKLKSLLDFSQKLEAADADETAISEAADAFVKGADKMKVHRQIFAANRLLENKKDLPKVLDLTKASVSGVDASLDAANASAAVLADELYESRRIAMARGQLIIVPDVARQTLLSIVRGRIEEISGWTLYQQGKTGEAVVRLKRAVSVLPEKSAWWRESNWRLGAALDADGKSKDALDAYLRSYADSQPDPARRIVIESVYQKINGNLEGLDEKIGAKPVTANIFEAKPASSKDETVAQNVVRETPEISPTATPETTPAVETTPAPTPETKPTVEMTPAPTPEIKSTVEVQRTPIVEMQPTPETQIAPTPEPKPTVEPTPEPTLTPTPSPEVLPTPEPSPTPESSPTIEPSPSPESSPTPTPEPEQVAQITEKTPDLPTKSEIVPPVASTPEPKTENFTVVTTTLDSKTEKKLPPEKPKSETNSDKSAKLLFEPIIINVPKTETAKPEIKPDEAVADVKSPDENVVLKVRPRIVPEKKSDLPAEEIASCKIVASQENISLINGGGNLGILVGFETSGDLKEITASSSSPNDVEVTLEPDIGAQSGRAFFVIRSISQNKGIYNISFDAPCGKKTVLVKVR